MSQNSKKSKAESPWSMAWRHFKRNKMAVFGLILLTIIVFSAIFAPLLAPHDPNKTKILK